MTTSPNLEAALQRLTDQVADLAVHVVEGFAEMKAIARAQQANLDRIATNIERQALTAQQQEQNISRLTTTVDRLALTVERQTLLVDRLLGDRARE